MAGLLPGIIMSFREGLEALLVVVIILKFLDKTGNNSLKKGVLYGALSGVAVSVLCGVLLYNLSKVLLTLDAIGKLWESMASIAAVLLVTTFIIWMIKHSKDIKSHIEKDTAVHLSLSGIILISFIMIAREGVEIAIFTFAAKYSILSILIGLSIAALFILLINYSLLRVNLNVLFSITLFYLILQAGYLFGYGIHEGLSALKSLEILGKDNILLIKVFNLSGTVLNHKQGIIGLPLNVLIGWYSKPEWIQFVSQYALTFFLFGYWLISNKKKA